MHTKMSPQQQLSPTEQTEFPFVLVLQINLHRSDKSCLGLINKINPITIAIEWIKACNRMNYVTPCIDHEMNLLLLLFQRQRRGLFRSVIHTVHLLRPVTGFALSLILFLRTVFPPYT
jgi:hypothetical protein